MADLQYQFFFEPLINTAPLNVYFNTAPLNVYFILHPILLISPYSVQMRENVDHNNSEYGHFLRSEIAEQFRTYDLRK